MGQSNPPHSKLIPIAREIREAGTSPGFLCREQNRRRVGWSHPGCIGELTSSDRRVADTTSLPTLRRPAQSASDPRTTDPDERFLHSF